MEVRPTSSSVVGDKWFRTRKTPIEEKGMKFNSEDGIEDAFINEIIDHHQWDYFVRQPGSFYVDLVMEFCNNLDKKSNVSTVRGVTVDYSAATINKLYNLPDVNDEVTRAFLETPNLDLMDEKLCPFGATWDFDAKSEKGSILGTNICNRMDLNVGCQISKNIKEWCFESKKRKLWFPSTITRLILNAGALPGPNMMETISDMEINKTIWNRMEDTYGPRKMEGENEVLHRNRRRQAQCNMELLNARFENFKFETNQNMQVMERRLMNKLERVEHIQMQEIMYTTTTVWSLANFVKRMSEFKWGYTEPCQFHQFKIVDLSFCPIPKYSDFLIPEDYINLDQQVLRSEYAPQPSMPPPPPDPIDPVVFETNNNMFDGFQNLSDVFEGYNPLFQPSARGNKRSREDVGRGKQVMEEANTSGDFNWIDVIVNPPPDESRGGDDNHTII